MAVRIREADARAYAAYLEQYGAGALRCRTADELRAYGPPAGPAAGLELGSTLSEDLDLQHAYDRQQHAWLSTMKDVGEHVLRLERRPVPLDVFFDASVTAKVQVGGRGYGGTLSARGGVAPQLGAAGVTLEPGRVEVGADGGVAGAKAAFAAGRLESVEVAARAAPGVRAFTRQSRSAVEAGLAVGGKAGGKGGGPGVHVEARASVGVNVLTVETARWALSSRSFWKGEK
jgi:hypothetical protein